MKIQHLLSLAILVLIYSCNSMSMESQNAAGFTPTKQDTSKLYFMKEVQWPKAYKEQDSVLLNSILAEDFKMIDASGNWYSKEDELNWIKKNAMKNDSFRYEIKRFDILENGTAIIAGTGHIYTDSTHSTYQSSNVLIHRNNEWKAVLSHVSGIKKE